MYIMLRIAPMLAAIFILSSTNSVFHFFYVMTASSFILFLVTLYVFSPNIKCALCKIENKSLTDIYRIAFFLVFLKFLILFSATGSLPVFGGSGSDSFIAFAENNKVGTSFLLAIGASELTLLSFILPFCVGKRRALVIIALILSSLMIFSAGKKSSLLVIFLALAYGDYLRVSFTQSRRKLFTDWRVALTLISGSFFWAIFQYKATTGNLDLPEVGIISFVLDLIFTQWAYPVFLFASGELFSFFEQYTVNKFTYFFHTVLSPLGFPAFSSSIGPAIHEYQTGSLTGNGINPSFLLEGYVIFGAVLPLYSFIVAFMVGRVRYYISGVTNMRNKVVLHALFLPMLYILPVDALLFMKIVIALIILSPMLFVISRGIKV